MYTIDLWEDGVGVSIEKMAANAGIDVSELMAFDMPCDGSLSRVPDGTGDLHVDLDDLAMADEEGWSDFCGFAPATRAKEPEPADTTPPFNQDEALLNVPGLFGGALRAYGEAFACYSVHGVDTTNLRACFQAMWGIDEDSMVQFDRLMPVARSSGDSFWGGWARNLQPANFSLPATQSAVHAKFHNLNRTAFGPHALVDWPRIKAIAEVTCGRLLADDVYVKNRVRRVDFAIDPREVIHAPQKLQIAQVEVTGSKNAAAMNNTYVIGAINYLAAQDSGGASGIRYHTGDTIIVEQAVEIPRHVVYSLPVTFKAPIITTPLVLVESPDMGTEDLQVRDRSQNLRIFKSKNFDVEQVLKAIAIGSMKRMKNISHRSFGIRASIIELESKDDGKRQKAKKLLVDAIKKVWPDNVLSSLVGYGNVNSPGHGVRLIADLLERAGEGTGMLQEHNYNRLWARLINMPAVLRILAGVLASAILYIDRQISPDFSNRYIELLAKSGDFGEVLNEIFSARKRYWVNRYIRTAKDVKGVDRERFVLSQVRAKVFMKAKFRINEGGAVELLDVECCNALTNSAVNYIRHRKKEYDSSNPVYTKLQICSGSLDTLVSAARVQPANPRFSELANKIWADLKEFEVDVREFLRSVLMLTKHTNEESGHQAKALYDKVLDVDKQVLEKSHPAMEDLPDIEPKPAKVANTAGDLDDMFAPMVKKRTVKEKVKVEDKNLEGDDMGGMFSLPIKKKVQEVDLANELIEEIPGIPIEVVHRAVNKYGQRVDVKKLDAIALEFREIVVKEHYSAVRGVDLEEDYN